MKFSSGKKVLTVRDISSFAVRPENENALIEVKNGKHFATVSYQYNDGLLKEVISACPVPGTDKLAL